MKAGVETLMTPLRLYGKIPRCWWCGKKLPDESRQIKFEMSGKQYETAVCSEEHGRAVVRSYRYVRKVFYLFPIGIATGLVLFMGGSFVHADLAIFAGLATLGATVFVCPFTTPQTVQMIGLRRSFRIGRVAGVILFLGAIGLMVFLR